VVHDTRHTDVPPLPYDICISPRQSFGTGNHNTTRMIMEWLLKEDLRGKDVIDAGTGTGVLSIMSILRGACHVLAYDIDEWSVDNAKDNLLLNGMGSAQVEVRQGNASVLKHDDQADLLMANINRNILLADMQTFASAIDKRKGRLLLSGFYQEDIPLLLQAAASNHLHLEEQETDDNWAMLVFAKNISSDSQNKA
ncbi:MAG: 50S ribosomal protein L11 methyltransferase, partial [Bacteroidaceae bacterium]|nr:50S ribosomal protein L11 methyltransferase [Paraprevotella sp.]MDY2715694.1 50S ribosomal protein L11 methyltransferase [Bacteroidaceae bacterium]